MDKRLLPLLLLTVICPALAGKVYQWRDADGNVFYSDRPPDGRSARERAIKPNVVQSQSAGQDAGTGAGLVFYTASGCPSCDEARRLLDDNRIPYQAKVPTEDAKLMQELVTRAGADNLVPPVLEINGQFVKGWNRFTWSAVLRQAGYTITEPAR
ncbi:glutaredoxin family protein [Chitiniphilus purpureus]|uniref:Glutaredoxin family protein n=1 Tax=Chitiniphilus purpureus TaxID=2981137 RepID=A0ABY6DK38_9NEIS|nr:glutaredoxin family protein [Chitiniphilus sp. CD1]UXY14720.1 glutaredoxin family protein [Chitiniphilus sp. CD1]